MADEPEITVPVGQVARLTLPGHGSSGRVWSFVVEGDTGAVSVVREAGRAPDRPPPGGAPPPSYSLDEIMVISGVQVGTADLVFTLRRPGEMDRPPAEQRRIRVRVTPPG